MLRQCLVRGRGESSGYTHSMRKMTTRSWIRIAAVAVILCLVMLLVPHCGTVDTSAFVFITILILALDLSCGQLSPFAWLRFDRVAETPALPPAFQRPPPLRLS